MRWVAKSHALAAALALFAQGAQAAVSNRTIDDNAGDSVTGAKPVFQPTDGWNYGPDCPGCYVQPDKSQCFDNSWHDVTVSSNDTASVTLSFTGTAIYVFGIVPNYVQYATTNTNVTFTLDGQPAGSFVHVIDPTSSDYAYNVPVYTNGNLNNVEHTLVIHPTAGDERCLFLFDYAIYTFEDDPITTTVVGSPQTVTKVSISTASPTNPGGTTTPSPSPSLTSPTAGSQSGATLGKSSGGLNTIPASSRTGAGDNLSFNPSATRPAGSSAPSDSASASAAADQASSSDAPATITPQKATNVGAIAGGVVGGLLVLAALLGLLLCFRRRRQRANDLADMSEKSPYHSPSHATLPPPPDLSYSGSQMAQGQAAAPVATSSEFGMRAGPSQVHASSVMSVTRSPASASISPFADPGPGSIGRHTPDSSLTPRQAKLAALHDSSRTHSPATSMSMSTSLIPGPRLHPGPASVPPSSPRSEAHTLIGTTVTGTTAFADTRDAASFVSAPISYEAAPGRWDQDENLPHRPLPTLPATVSDKSRLASSSEKARYVADGDDNALRERLQMLEAEVDRLRQGGIVSDVPPAYASQ